MQKITTRVDTLTGSESGLLHPVQDTKLIVDIIGFNFKLKMQPGSELLLFYLTTLITQQQPGTCQCKRVITRVDTLTGSESGLGGWVGGGWGH